MTVDKEEFIRVMDDNQAIINKVCYGYTNNSEDRLDLKQEMLIQLWKAYPNFNQKAKISTWIYKIALNTAISNFRKTKNKILTGEYTNDILQAPEQNQGTELDDNIIRLYQLIYQLNDLEKAIILLYLDDKSYKDIAEIVGLSESNVATKINRIKSKLKNQFVINKS